MINYLKIEELKKVNANQANYLLSLNDRKRKLDAKLFYKVNDLLTSISKKFNISNVIGEINPASKKSFTYNLGEQLEALTRAVIEKVGDLDKWQQDNTLASLVNNTPNNINQDKNYYIIVVKATTQGLYLITKETIASNNLKGLRLTLTNVLTYGEKLENNILMN